MLLITVKFSIVSMTSEILNIVYNLLKYLSLEICINLFFDIDYSISLTLISFDD